MDVIKPLKNAAPHLTAHECPEFGVLLTSLLSKPGWDEFFNSHYWLGVFHKEDLCPHPLVEEMMKKFSNVESFIRDYIGSNPADVPGLAPLRFSMVQEIAFGKTILDFGNNLDDSPIRQTAQEPLAGLEKRSQLLRGLVVFVAVAGIRKGREAAEELEMIWPDWASCPEGEELLASCP